MPVARQNLLFSFLENEPAVEPRGLNLTFGAIFPDTSLLSQQRKYQQKLRDGMSLMTKGRTSGLRFMQLFSVQAKAVRMSLQPTPKDILRRLCEDLLPDDVVAVLYLTNSAVFGSNAASVQYVLQLLGYLGVPVIAWNADNIGLDQRVSQARVLQLAPSVVHQVAAIFAILERYAWYQFAVVTTQLGGHEDFVRAVRDRQLESSGLRAKFSVLAVYTLRGHTRQEFRSQLEPVATGEARVLLLFASKEDSREVFAAVSQLGMTSKNYVWIVTQSVIGAHPGLAPPEYPAGLLETLTDAPALMGYREHVCTIGRKGIMHPLVRKDLTFVYHELGGVQRFRPLLQKALKTAGSQTLIAGGDFNAAEAAGVTVTARLREETSHKDTQELDFALITDPRSPTRLGNSATRDTSPGSDVRQKRGDGDVTWSNTTVDLGSDHAIIEIHVPTPDRMQGSKRTFTWTDWEDFRKQRDRQQLHEAEEITGHRSVVPRSRQTSTPTRWTAAWRHLIEAKNSILARWTKQRLNRRLRKKVAELNCSFEEHCRTVNRQHILLDATNTKSHQRDHLAHLIHKEIRERGKDVVAAPCERNTFRDHDRAARPVQGRAHRRIRDFSVEEIRTALHELNSRSAPGPDGNLDGRSMEQLTDYINTCWRRSSLPRKKEEEKINVLIRRVYKIVLGLPESTGTDRLFQLGIHNTLNEIAEAQRTSQLERLSGTNAGRRILENLGIGYHTQQGHKVTLPVAIRQTIRVDPIPRNVHPEYNRGRREARAKALLNAHSNNVGTRFVDAAEFERGSRFAVTVVDSDGETKISASVTFERAEEAEEIAVAIALTDPACKTVLCDSIQGIRNFAKGRISLRAARIISQRQVHREPEPPTRLLWFPAHVGEVSEEHRNGNETAHARARELTNRTGDGRPWYNSKDRMTSFNEITKAFRLARRTLPPLSDKLDRAQAVALRQLQTRTYPNPAQYHRMFPEIYTTNACKVCRKEVATLTHMLCDCTKDPHGANSGTLPPRLSAALCSPSLGDQLWAVQQACEAMKRQDFDAPRRAKRTSGNAPKRVT
ncbi:hypothetical protein HPB47_004863 [Ixodes persulcatus]|uniref:Uncharacterized protein n=1 Tax=Ixodes persulcatus TaxID=34615 RepID=A0AC60PET2_IXOPE|nr:hypothetical protein HPB47_004863 [Ixodes persulcatus]